MQRPAVTGAEDAPKISHLHRISPLTRGSDHKGLRLVLADRMGWKWYLWSACAITLHERYQYHRLSVIQCTSPSCYQSMNYIMCCPRQNQWVLTMIIGAKKTDSILYTSIKYLILKCSFLGESVIIYMRWYCEFPPPQHSITFGHTELRQNSNINICWYGIDKDRS